MGQAEKILLDSTIFILYNRGVKNESEVRIMKAVIMKASDSYWSKIKYFKNLKDLLEFMDSCGHGLILEKNCYDFNDKEKAKCEYTITIYDDYVE